MRNWKKSGLLGTFHIFITFFLSESSINDSTIKIRNLKTGINETFKITEMSANRRHPSNLEKDKLFEFQIAPKSDEINLSFGTRRLTCKNVKVLDLCRKVSGIGSFEISKEEIGKFPTRKLVSIEWKESFNIENIFNLSFQHLEGKTVYIMNSRGSLNFYFTDQLPNESKFQDLLSALKLDKSSFKIQNLDRRNWAVQSGIPDFRFCIDKTFVADVLRSDSDHFIFIPSSSDLPPKKLEIRHNTRILLHFHRNEKENIMKIFENQIMFDSKIINDYHFAFCGILSESHSHSYIEFFFLDFPIRLKIFVMAIKKIFDIRLLILSEKLIQLVVIGEREKNIQNTKSNFNPPKTIKSLDCTLNLEENLLSLNEKSHSIVRNRHPPLPNRNILRVFERSSFKERMAKNKIPELKCFILIISNINLQEFMMRFEGHFKAFSSNKDIKRIGALYLYSKKILIMFFDYLDNPSDNSNKSPNFQTSFGNFASSFGIEFQSFEYSTLSLHENLYELLLFLVNNNNLC